MVFSIGNFSLKKIISYVDWKLLLFLLLFLNVKLALKVPAIIIIYLLQFNFRFGFSLKNSRLPLFYPLIIVIAFIGLAVNLSSGNPDYLMVFLIGIGFWLLSLLAIHQVKLSVENNDTQIIHQTILVFFLINTVFSFLNLAHIIWETGDIIPYRYQGQYQKYFISTGDYIKGVTFDTSTTNAVLNAFGVIYFLVKKSPAMVLTCMTVLLLTGSNTINLALLFIFLFLFLFQTNKYQKSLIVVCLMFLVIFMVKISPENNDYADGIFEKTFGIQTAAHKAYLAHATPRAYVVVTPKEVKRKFAKHYQDSISDVLNNKKRIKIAPETALTHIPKTNEGRIYFIKEDITAFDHQWSKKSSPEQKLLMSFIQTHESNLPISRQNNFRTNLPGKAIGLIQTATYFEHHPDKIIMGAGMGNFSSKLAFRVTSLGFWGGYPAKHAYINKDFLANHLDLYLYFFSKLSYLHSLVNSPYSVYDQLLAEYGLAGLLTLVIFYLGFFAKHYSILTYGIPLLMLTAGIFFIDYWFEQLSILIMFELMLFLNIKEGKNIIEKPVLNNES
jgi:hypothetical protein